MSDIVAELLGSPLDGDFVALQLTNVFVGLSIHLDACEGFRSQVDYSKEWGPDIYTLGYYILSKNIPGGNHWEAIWQPA